MHTERMACNICSLTGKGLEYLIDQEGNVRAIFLNGNMCGSVSADNVVKLSGSTEPTIIQ